MDEVPAEASYAGSPARPMREALREAAALRKLPALVKQQARG
jgi:UDP-3-O-[3-hydroxymyristoyl] glucosamine N-acyltransferase